MLLPHTYQSFTASGLKYWSEFGADGGMHCMTFEPVAINPATKRAVKMAGGRNRIQRPDNGGLCDPDHCAQFQRKECQLRGKLYFFIPGIPTIALMQLSTGSINGLEAVRSQMMTVAAARRGRLSGFLDDDAATFVLSKQQMEVPGIDEETGQPIRRQQQIITLSAKMDLTQLYRVQNPRLLTHQGGEAAAALNGEAVNAMSDYPVAESGDIEGSDAMSAGELQTNPSQSRNAPPAQAVSVPPAERISASASPNASASSSATPLDEIYRMLDEMKIDRELFDKYAQKKWGSWKANAKGVEKVIGDVTANRNDPDAYVKKIDSEVNVFS